jgi:UDP-glucose 4-epimerase
MARAVLVTGGTGFLGRTLVAALLDRGDQVVVISRSDKAIDPRCFTVRAELNQLDLSYLPPLDYQSCFHFAGASSVPLSWQHPLKDFADSLPGTVGLIHFLARYHPHCRLLVASSAAVYGNPTILPVKESAKIAPISPYGVHKAAIELLCEHYARLLQLPIIILRIFSAYGPSLRKQLLWDTTQKLATAAVSGHRTISLGGSGVESRDFLHCRDVARAAILLADTPQPILCHSVNVASGSEIQIRHVAKLICDAWGGGLSSHFNGEIRAGDPQRWVADISKLRALGFSPEVVLEAGIRDYVAWVKTEYSI